MNFSSFISPNRIVKNPIPNPQTKFSGKLLKIPLNISLNSSFIKLILSIKLKNYYTYLKIPGYIDQNKAIFKSLNGMPFKQIRYNENVLNITSIQILIMLYDL